MGKKKSRSHRKKNPSTASSSAESSGATSDAGAGAADATGDATTAASAGRRGGPIVGPRDWDPRATAENVLMLPLANHHIWKCALHESSDSGPVLGIMDITSSNAPRAMAFGPYPDPVSAPEDFVKALFCTMLAPTPSMAGTETGDFHQPRRPRFLLLDRKIEPAYAHVKEKLEAVGVPVRIYSDESEAEAGIAVFDPPPDPLKCTWADALQLDRDRFRPTVSRVKELPQNKDQVWKCFPYDNGKPGTILFVMEDITKPGPARAVGVGPISLLSIPEAILGVMLAPKYIDQASPDLTEDEPRRPGLLVLHEVIGHNEGADYIRHALLGSGVQIVSSAWHDQQQQREQQAQATTSCCAACEKPEFSGVPLQICARCRAVVYCNRECQMAHWKKHKKACNS
jgi:hypothetical protein